MKKALLMLVAVAILFPAAVLAQAAPAASGDKIPTKFTYKPDTSVKTANLAGDFNAWSTTATPMTLDAATSSYVATVNLTKGTHTYKFVVDGKWLPDPNNKNVKEDGFGGKNSVIEVK